MDHDTAVRLNATERYFLGELSVEDRDGFEAHFFSCTECSEDLRALTVFAANAKAVLRQKPAGPPSPATLWSGKALWLSAGLNVLLILGMGYAWLKVGPEAPQYVQEVAVLGAARSAGDGPVRDIARATRRIVFSFYLTEKFQNIGYELKNTSGTVRSQQILPPPPREASAESYISIPASDLKPGPYEVAFWGIGANGRVPIGQSKFRIASE